MPRGLQLGFRPADSAQEVHNAVLLGFECSLVFIVLSTCLVPDSLPAGGAGGGVCVTNPIADLAPPTSEHPLTPSLFDSWY